MRQTSDGGRTTASVGLWIVQGVLAALFLFAGGMKLVMPIEAMTQQGPPLPGFFIRFIGVVEVLGALGLLLPGLTRVRPELTPLAAAGLVIVMSGAVGTVLVTAGVAAALVPGAVGLLAAVVAHGRWRVAPHRAAPRWSIRLRALRTAT